MTDGQALYNLCERLYPIHRSITGHGFRESLDIIRGIVPEIEVHEVPTGTKCFDWEIPQEWYLADAYLKGPDGDIVCSLKDNNLHVMSYSQPVCMSVSYDHHPCSSI